MSRTDAAGVRVNGMAKLLSVAPTLPENAKIESTIGY